MALGTPQDDGATLRDHLESLARQTGEIPEQLKPVGCPDSIKYLWGYFLSMSARRTNSGFGPNPISDEDVDAWARRHRIVLEPFENDALDAIEQLYLSIQTKRDAK